MHDQQILRQAFHEAGHAIGSRQLGLRVSALSLDAATSMVPLFEDDGQMTDSGRRRFATVSYCGPISEAQHRRLTSDECTALWLDGAPWCGDRANIEKCKLSDAERTRARVLAERLVAIHWRKIDALAAALVEHDGTMTGAEVETLLRGVFPF